MVLLSKVTYDEMSRARGGGDGGGDGVSGIGARVRWLGLNVCERDGCSDMISVMSQ